jgi:hypothetical protein
MSTTIQRKSRLHVESEPVDPILRPREIEELTGVDWKTIRRAKSEDVLQLGKRAVGMYKSAVLRPLPRPR